MHARTYACTHAHTYTHIHTHTRTHKHTPATNGTAAFWASPSDDASLKVGSRGMPYCAAISRFVASDAWMRLNMKSRVGQNHIYTVCIRCFWEGNHHIYGHIRCIYTVLAILMKRHSIMNEVCTWYILHTLSWWSYITRTHTHTHSLCRVETTSFKI